MKVKAILDPQFIPMALLCREMREATEKDGQDIVIGIERNKGYISAYRTRVYPDGVGKDELNFEFIERMVKALLWVRGGYKIIIAGSELIGNKIKDAYAKGGLRDFDNGFMSRVYERPFEVVVTTLDKAPVTSESASPVGRHLDGCRIGFDAGGSDRKVSAVIDGEAVFSEEVVWFPKTNADPKYHYDGILQAMKTAASHMPRVDGIGVSSAGVFIGNSPMVSSLFIKVPREKRELVKTIYDRAAKELGDVPIVVANDGDVTALAGAMGLETGSVMGMAMGTSEAVGYVDADGNVLGWLNELAFAPVDLFERAEQDEWSTDLGVGCKYFSQDAVIKLAPRAGIELDDALTPAEKLKAVQELAERGDERAKRVFASIGAYLAHTLKLYCRFYDVHHMIVLGRVMSGIGGSIILDNCLRILREEYPALNEKVRVMLPDEKTRRVGQSVAAASLPERRA